MKIAHHVSHEVLQSFLDGNERFRTGQRHHEVYTPERLLEIAESQHPQAGVVTCMDSRVNADVIFDQPLGSLFASRVPGNVAADSTLWMVDIAVGEFKVPLVMVMGHTRCLTITQLMDGDSGGPGGIHRWHIREAIQRSRGRNPQYPLTEAIIENTNQTVDRLILESPTLRRAVQDGQTVVAGALYEMETGNVRILQVRDSLVY